MEKKSFKDSIYFGRALFILLFMIGITVVFLSFPEPAKVISAAAFRFATYTLGTPVMLFVLVYFGFSIWLVFSKYGKIKLGEGKPKYSTFSWFAMIFCSGAAAATCYWAFNEWPQLYTYMQGNFAAGGGGANVLGGVLTDEAKVELARAYNMFDWNPSYYAIMSMPAIPMAYYYYNKKMKSWTFDTSCKSAIDKPWFRTFSSVIGLLGSFTALAWTTSLGIDLITVPLCYVFGTEPTFGLKVGLMIFVSALFTLSSYIGIGKGMKRISSFGAYSAIGLCIYILLFSGFGINIINSTFSSIGLMTNEFFRMSTWLEPYTSSNMAQDWPVFYGFSWILYAPFVGMFIAKVSEGRTIREVAAVSVLGGTAGVYTLHGAIGGYVAELMFAGKVNVLQLAQDFNGPEIVIQTLMNLPFGNVMIVVFAVTVILFLATTMDSGSHALASGTTRILDKNGETSPMLRFFWCIFLAGYPLTLVFIKANISTLKSLQTFVTIPIFFMVAVQVVSFMKDLRKDYGDKDSREIEAEFKM